MCRMFVIRDDDGRQVGEGLERQAVPATGVARDDRCLGNQRVRAAMSEDVYGRVRARNRARHRARGASISVNRAVLVSSMTAVSHVRKWYWGSKPTSAAP